MEIERRAEFFLKDLVKQRNKGSLLKMEIERKCMVIAIHRKGSQETKGVS